MRRHLILGLLCSLGATVGLSTWQMLVYRDEWHDIVSNDRWEVHLRQAGVFEAPRAVLFGDSILGSWPMAESFGALPVLNRGAFGEWALNAGDRFERDVLSLKPTIVVILFGANDLEHQQPVSEIIANVGRLIDRAQVKGIKVILCGILPASGHWLQHHAPAVIRSLNLQLLAMAESHGIEFVNFYPTLADGKGEFTAALTRDGLHPDEAGYSRMTNQLLPIMLRDLDKVR